MFGYVTANPRELDRPLQQRYQAVYCGICRQLRARCSQSARLALSYDMAFLALLLMSLYEPQENSGRHPCLLHCLGNRSWTDNEYIRYAADMNMALAYYKALDDRQDDASLSSRVRTGLFAPAIPRLREEYPRQWQAMDQCIRELNALEAAGCSNPDLPAGCFGRLMGELLVYREDLWAPTLREMGLSLGRFVYLLDAAVDYRRDSRKNRYNPFLAMGASPDPRQWEDYLVLEMARATEFFEKLPLVQDKPLLDRILYSGVWMEFERLRPRTKGAQEENT